MTIATSSRRPLAILVALAVLVTGLALSPFAATSAYASNASDASAVLARVNFFRTDHAERPAFLRNAFIDKRAQEYAALYAASGSATKPLTKVPATALPTDPGTEGGTSAEQIRVFKVGGTTAKIRRDGASARFGLDGLPESTDANYGSVGYVTKGSYSYAVLLVAPYSGTPLDYRAAAAPKISGTVAVGRTLTATGVKFTPAVDPEAVQYDWKVGGSTVSNQPTYFIESNELGKSVTVTVSAVTDGFVVATATSKASAKIATGTIRISNFYVYGPRAVGSSLSTNYGFEYAPGIQSSFQWYRGTAKIEGATNTYYMQQAADFGKKVWIKITASAPGHKPFTTKSPAKLVTGYKQIENPGDASVTGDFTYGQTLAAVSTPWSNIVDDEPTPTATAPIKLSYQWYAEGSAIKGATKSTYKLPASSIGKWISVKVTGTQAKRSPTVIWGYSNSEHPVLPLQFESTGELAINGSFVKGKSVTAKVTGTSPSATYSYQWYIGETKIKGATQAKFVVTSAAAATGFVQVLVKVKRTGYETREIWGSTGIG